MLENRVGVSEYSPFPDFFRRLGEGEKVLRPGDGIQRPDGTYVPIGLYGRRPSLADPQKNNPWLNKDIKPRSLSP